MRAGSLGGQCFIQTPSPGKQADKRGGGVGRKEKAMHERGVLVAPRARGNR